MKNIFLLLLSLFVAFSCGNGTDVAVPVIHVTDLTRPYGDPDDHWDAACQYALARKGLIRLEGVVLDNLPSVGQPDFKSIGQLNFMTGLDVAVGVGQVSHDQPVGAGLDLIKKTLERASSPVTIHVCGGCLDISEAASLWPDLFAEKVGALYLYAGGAEESSVMEYNVTLHPEEYASMFNLPCPVYWLPCMQNVAEWYSVGGCVGKNTSFFKFVQGDVFQNLDDDVKNFFLCALSRYSGEECEDYLKRAVDKKALDSFGAKQRCMWCTPGILHGAGLTVLRNGEIVPSGKKNDVLFDFIPIEVSCTNDGHTSWTPANGPSDRYIFVVNDLEAYQAAMGKALSEIVSYLN